MNSRFLAQAFGLALSGTLVAGAAMAGETPKAEPMQTVTVQGVQVAIDPATGRLREPTAAERARLSAAMLQSRSSLATGGRPRTEAEARSTFVKTRLSSGATVTRVTVPQSLTNSVVAERLPDGSLNVHHDDGHPAQAKAPEVTR